MVRHVSSHPACRLGGEDLAHTDGVVAGDSVRFRRTGDISAACGELKVAPRPPPKPVVEDGFPRVEIGAVVGLGQQNRRAEWRLGFTQLATAAWLATAAS